MKNHTVIWNLFKSRRPSARVYFKLPKMALFQTELEYTRVINENIGIQRQKHIKRQEMRVSRMSAVRLSLPKDHKRASWMASQSEMTLTWSILGFESNTKNIRDFIYLKTLTQQQSYNISWHKWINWIFWAHSPLARLSFVLKHKRDDNIVSSENVSIVEILRRTNWVGLSKDTSELKKNIVAQYIYIIDLY